MRIRQRIVNSRRYYYLEESIRLDKTKVYSLFLGARLPPKAELDKRKLELNRKITAELTAGRKSNYLRDEQLIEAEKLKCRYNVRSRKLTPAQREEKVEIDAANFVYTTLTTEGVPITREDADLAYNLAGKKPRPVRDENLQVALDMIKGLREVRESRIGLDLDFILHLHQTIMEQYANKSPGHLRKKQARIFLKSYGRAEEIAFRPSEPARIMAELNRLLEWYNQSLPSLHPIELAALLHLRLYKIHPFEDGNKRMSRLMFNKAMHDSGYPMLNISKETARYFDALVSSVEKGDDRPFVQFVLESFCGEMKKGSRKQQFF